MSAFNWIEAIYGTMGMAMILFYIPQIKLLAQTQSIVSETSIPTWGFWSFGNLTNFMYGHFELKDPKFCVLSLLSGVCCFIVLGIILYKRRKYKLSVTVEANY